MTNNYALLDKDFLYKLDSYPHRTVYARIILLTNEEEPIQTIEGKITTGSVNIDGASAIRRTCSLTMAGQVLETFDSHWVLYNKFKLEVGIENCIDDRYDDIIWFKQGIFVFTSLSLSIQAANFTISLQGKDKGCLLNGEVGGVIAASTDFGKFEKYTTLPSGEIVREEEDVLIQDIIKNILHIHGNEDLSKIFINDLEEYGLELLEFNSDKYLTIRSLNGEIQDISLRKTPASSNKDEITYENYTYGEAVGYRKTALVYPGELVANVGETIVSILDKIKNMFSGFEYFYDVDGNFIFQKKKTYENESWLDETGDYMTSHIQAYDFKNQNLITAINYAPAILNMKNDFSVWGTKETIAGAEIPIHIRYAIDDKPMYYKSKEEKDENGDIIKESIVFYTQEYPGLIVSDIKNCLCDWREVLYQMAKDYFECGIDNIDEYQEAVAANNPTLYPTGKTGYEQYYTDIYGFWRESYIPLLNGSFMVEAGQEKQLMRQYILDYNDFSRFVKDDIGNYEKTEVWVENNEDSDTKEESIVGNIIERIKLGFPLYSPPVIIPLMALYKYHCEERDALSDEDGKISAKDNRFIKTDWQKYINKLIADRGTKAASEDIEYQISALRLIHDFKTIVYDWYTFKISEINKWAREAVKDQPIFVGTSSYRYNPDYFDIKFKNKTIKYNGTSNFIENFGYVIKTGFDDTVKSKAAWIDNLNKEKKNADYNKIISLYVKYGGEEDDIFPTVLRDTYRYAPKNQFYKLVDSSNVKYYHNLIIQLVWAKCISNGVSVSNSSVPAKEFELNFDFFDIDFEKKISELNTKNWEYVEKNQSVSSIVETAAVEKNVATYSDYFMRELLSLANDLKIIFMKDIREHKISTSKDVEEAKENTAWMEEYFDRIYHFDYYRLRRNCQLVFGKDNPRMPQGFIDAQDRFDDWAIDNFYETKNFYLSTIRATSNVRITDELINFMLQVENKDLIINGTLKQQGFELKNKGWHKDLYQNENNSSTLPELTLEDVKYPKGLKFWIDFLETTGPLSQFRVKTIGNRPKAINDSNIKAISYRGVPEIIYVFDGDDSVEQTMTGYKSVQVPNSNYESLFSISAQGKTALDEINNLLYQFTHMNTQITLTTVPIYHLEPNSIIYIENDNLEIAGYYVVNKITIPLQYNGTSSINASRKIDRLK